MKRLLLLTLIVAVSVTAQVAPQRTGSPATVLGADAATTTYVLNPEASAAYVEIAKRMAEIQKEFEMLRGQQVALMVATGIPASERDRQPTLGKDGTVSFAPKPTLKPEIPKVSQ